MKTDGSIEIDRPIGQVFAFEADPWRASACGAAMGAFCLVTILVSPGSLLFGAGDVEGGDEDGAVGRVFTGDGAWCWFQDPRALVLDGDRPRTVAQWMTRDGRLQVGAFDHGDGSVEIRTLEEAWDRDDHNVGAFAVGPDGRLTVFYARHNRPGLFCRTAVEPGSIDRWNDRVTVSASDRITYAHPVWLEDEQRFLVFWRGPTWKPTFAASRDGRTWSEPAVLLEDEGRSDRGIRPYLKAASDGRSTIHFAFTDGHPRDEPTNSVYYLQYRGGRFLRADGREVGSLETLPIRHRDSAVVHDGPATGVRAWVWDVAADREGRPVIAYTRLPGENDHRYAWARWTGDRWHDVEITPAGGWFPETPPGSREPEPHYSGGIALDHADPSLVVVARPVGGTFELEAWRTGDGGDTWTSRPLTRDSQHLNVRPVVARGSADGSRRVLWMSGSYEHYTRYRTGIHILTLEPNP